jgi:hypothetical protein
MSYKLPDPGWPREKKFRYAVERLKAESTRDQETTVDYWLAGVVINDIRKDRKANREWVAYLAANGLTRTRAHHAAQIATAFKSREELAGLTKTDARRAAAVKIRQDREAARLARGLPPRPPALPRPVPLVKSVEVNPENAWAILEQAAELVEASAMEARNTTLDPEIVKDVAKRLRGVLEHLEHLEPLEPPSSRRRRRPRPRNRSGSIPPGQRSGRGRRPASQSRRGRRSDRRPRMARAGPPPSTTNAALAIDQPAG